MTTSVDPHAHARAGAACGLAAPLSRALLVLVAPCLLGALGLAVWLSGESRQGALLGVLTAMLAAALACWIDARALAAPGADARASSRFAVALVGGFLVQVVLLVAGMLALSAAGMKFDALAAFGLVFAAVALLAHVLGVVVLLRATRTRARARTESCHA